MQQPRSPHIHGLMLVGMATVLWSTSGFFARAPLLDFWPVSQRGVQLAFWRVLFASLLLLPMIQRPTWTWRLLPAALSFALMNYCYLKALTTTTAANAIWLQYTAPVWVVLVGGWWLKETIRGIDVATVVCSMVGVMVIICGEIFLQSKTDITTSREGVFWGLAAGAMFAGVILSLRALRDLDSAWVVAACHVFAALLLLPTILAQVAWPSPAVLSWVAVFGMLQMGLPYWLFAKGTRLVSAHEAAFVGLFEPLLVPLWTFLFWRHSSSYESPALWTWIGAACILVGLLIRRLPIGKRVRQP